MRKVSLKVAQTILLLSMAGPVSAATINWSTAGLNESLILSAGGQTINNFSGIAGLDVVITGSSNLRAPTNFAIAPFTHQDGNLYLNTQLVAGDSNPVSMTFSFNKYVAMSANMNFFGDGGVQEEFQWSSNTGTFGATVGGDNTVFDDMTSLVRLTSGGNAASDFAQVSTVASKDFTVALGGLGFTGLAGSTVSMDIELTAVPLPASVWLLSSGFLGLIGFAKRKV